MLEEWKLLVLVDVKFFEVPNGNTGLLLDEATSSLNDAQQSVHPGIGSLMSWLLCERTCRIGLLCNNKSRSRVHQLLNQAWPGGWEMVPMQTALRGELERPFEMIAYPSEVCGECPRVYVFEYHGSDNRQAIRHAKSGSDTPYDLERVWRRLDDGGYGEFNQRNTMLVSKEATALQRCGVVSLGSSADNPIDKLCHCLQRLLAAMPADVAEYMQGAASDTDSQWSFVSPDDYCTSPGTCS